MDDSIPPNSSHCTSVGIPSESDLISWRYSTAEILQVILFTTKSYIRKFNGSTCRTVIVLNRMKANMQTVAAWMELKGLSGVFGQTTVQKSKSQFKSQELQFLYLVPCVYKNCDIFIYPVVAHDFNPPSDKNISTTTKTAHNILQHVLLQATITLPLQNF